MRRMASLLVAMTAMGAVATAASAMEPPKVGKQAPGFELKDTQGKTHQLKDFRGQIVVLHFQQIGCPWEKGYQPYFNKVAKQYASNKVDGETVEVQFLAINSNHTESVDELKRTKKNRPVAYPILKDPGNVVADKYAAKTTPHIYIIDQQGKLRYRGGVEKAPSAPSEVTKSDEQYLEPALKALIRGSEVPHKVTRSKGCGIKRE